MENSEHRFLAEAPTGKLMRRYAMPCVISLLVGALYNIVDQIFIANASYLGSFGNAANTVVFPMTVIALAIAVMIGDGLRQPESREGAAGGRLAQHGKCRCAVRDRGLCPDGDLPAAARSASDCFRRTGE